MSLSLTTRQNIGRWLTGLGSTRRSSVAKRRAYHDLRNQSDRILDDVGLVRDHFHQTVRRSDLPF
ncbi:MAG: hypothetical protein AAF667_19575 [Pseudomonadota bacterium]